MVLGDRVCFVAKRKLKKDFRTDFSRDQESSYENTVKQSKGKIDCTQPRHGCEKAVLELITLRCRQQIHKRQEILTRQFFPDQEGARMCSLQLSKHASTKWLTVALPYTPDSLYLPLTWDLSMSKVHNLLDWLKGLRDE
jgi:hypothetical protein